MKLRIYIKYVLILFFGILVLSSCHTSKVAMKGKPGQIVEPQADVAEKYAAVMGVKNRDIQNGRLYAFIEQWAGTPYKFGGQDKDGIDCSGLTQLLQQEVYGIKVPRMTSQQVTIIKRKYEEELKEGDLVFFDFDGKQFSHVGVYLQNGYFVHASTRKGVMVARLRDNGIYKFFSRAGSINIDQAITSLPN
ncbi:C40 family peptidase [Mucilaginibacter auburnensis]|uniref:Lipoprotein Spr/probable lipoprotein NlpC n=1 Tax=Mucilaginibacter auburnensis TaxID=1457233 RepID=A0A2H9VVM1_9SPHI|nr:NlpC/P60 family protein [Mucilaginibacter auburnensis]PJJ84870.1 lipoprotein Spr/probable lipoprotein NlpC [Mucilaginibacter auburnensis]